MTIKQRLIRSLTASCLATVLTSGLSPAYAQAARNPWLPDSELFRLAWDTYERSDWIYATMHLNAFIQRNPKVLQTNATLAKQIGEAWYHSAVQMERARNDAQALPGCQQQLASLQPGPHSKVSGLSTAPPEVDWKRIKAAAQF